MISEILKCFFLNIAEAIQRGLSSSGILCPKDVMRCAWIYKSFLQFTAVVVSMKFKLEEPHRALSPSGKPCSVETLVLLGLTLRSGWISWAS